MSGSIQSSDYVPGVSGWKLNNLTGEFEFISCAGEKADKAPEPKMVSVEVASWSKWDLPKNAANLIQFMEAELQKVPEQYRHAAEFEEFDASYGDDSFNTRLFLSYSRLETEEEVAHRLKKARVAGTRVVKAGGCTTIICDGVVRVRYGNLDAPLPEPEQTRPFAVEDDQGFVGEAAVQAAAIDTCKIGPIYSLKMQRAAGGQYFATGYGLGVDMGSNGEIRPDIIVKASHMEILPDGLVKITQAPRKG